MDTKRLAAMKRVREFRRTLALADVMAQERTLQESQGRLRDAKEAYERDHARSAASEAGFVQRSRTERCTLHFATMSGSTERFFRVRLKSR